jgi:hypothetical protein
MSGLGLRKQFPRQETKPVIGTFKLTADGEDLTYSIDPGLTVPMDQQKARNDKRAEADADRLFELLEGQDFGDLMSVRSVRKVLNCGQDRAQRAIDAYKLRNRLGSVA